MIEVYSWPTPNGHKVHILLEEIGLDYRVHPVDIGAGEQFDPEFLAISPNNKIPALVDSDGPGGRSISLFESGAILIYLAEKANAFYPREPRVRYTVLEWLMFQMGSIGPMLGQAHHFRRYAPEPIPYAIERYTNEANRLYSVLDRRLGESHYLAGNEYTIADIAVFPWVRSSKSQGVDMTEYPNVLRWYAEIAERHAVKRGLKILSDKVLSFDERVRENLFGARQYRRRP
ncbi:MAG: glutathione S-transferase N-terminal domain-containing protein [Methylohalobius crimeensis]